MKKKITKYTNYFISLITVALTLNFLLAPAYSLAQTATPSQTTKTICNQITEIESKVGQRITDHKTKIQLKRQELHNHLIERQNQRDTQIQKNRTKWNTNRQEHYAKLEAQAKTDAQKQAVAVFKSTLEQAITTRKAKIDEAIQAFRSNISSTIANRQLAIDAAIKTFQDSQQEALLKAKTDCSNGIDPKIIRQTLHANLKAAREKFRSDIQKIEKIKNSIKTAAENRKQTIAKIQQDFKATLEKARLDLKTAFEKQ
jgi:hypothetical protein